MMLTMKPRNVEEFDNMVEKHHTVDKLKGDDKRESKVANLKKKILDTLKVEEKKKRDLSCESVKSDCSGWGQGGANSDRERSLDIRGEIRNRSEDEELEPKAKKTLRKSRQLLRPPKIILKQ